MVTMDSSVDSTYSALLWAALRWYSCAMEVRVAQAGVMAARYTVIKMERPSGTQAAAFSSRSTASTAAG